MIPPRAAGERRASEWPRWSRDGGASGEALAVPGELRQILQGDEATRREITIADVVEPGALGEGVSLAVVGRKRIVSAQGIEVLHQHPARPGVLALVRNLRAAGVRQGEEVPELVRQRLREMHHSGART